jgi:probable selenium-dependent hydroxylase accessory protein YqeC
VIGVIGLDALGKAITEDYVHRPNLFCSITGKKMGDIIDRKCLTDLILLEDGLFKDAPRACRRYVVFNKADYADRQEEAKITVNELIEMQPPVNGFIIAATDNGYVYAEWLDDKA